jgi:hypothetical protein
MADKYGQLDGLVLYAWNQGVLWVSLGYSEVLLNPEKRHSGQKKNLARCSIAI